MDVSRQNEERMSDHRSHSSNHRYCSQSRKISVGVLADSISKAKPNDLQEPEAPTAGTQTYSKRNCTKDRDRHTPLKEKPVIVEPKDTSPWVSTRSLNRNISSSVAAQDTDRTPNSLATRRTGPRSKLLEKASAANSVKSFAVKSGIASDICGQKDFGRDTCFMENGKVDNAEQVEIPVRSTEQGARLVKEQVPGNDKTTETGGRETLRMKLWEVLGDVSTPSKHIPNLQCEELHLDEEKNRKQSPVEEINPNSDTIESDSQTHIFTRPMTHSLTRRKASTKKQSKIRESPKSIDRKGLQRRRIFSFKGDRSEGLFDKFDDGSVPCKRKKTLRMSFVAETDQDANPKNVQERQQSENIRSIPAAEKLMVDKNKVSNTSSCTDRRKDIAVEPKKSTENNASFEFSLNEMTAQRDVHKPMGKASKKNQLEDTSDSLLKKRRNSVHVPPAHPSKIESHDSLLKSNQEELHGRSPGERIFNETSIRSFKSFLSTKLAECEQDVQQEPSVGMEKQNNSPKSSFPVKPSIAVDEEGDNRISESSTDEKDSESSEDESNKDCGKSEESSPEIRLSENILNNSHRSFGNDKDVGVIGSSPASASLKEGEQEASDIEMYLEENHDDDLTRAVALLTKAVVHVKTKLKSLSSRRSAHILRAAVEEIFLQLQNAESLIKTDMGKLINHSHSKGKQLETRFQEKQEQLLGIHKRFKTEVEQHLQDCGSLIEDLEEHQMELKRSVEKQRAVHKKFLSQVEQEINVQLDNAESRILAIEKTAREKMLQLKQGVTECLHGVLS